MIFLLSNILKYVIIAYVEIVNKSTHGIRVLSYLRSFSIIRKELNVLIRLHGQAVKTSPFHGGNTGSIPVGVIELCLLILL